MALVIPNAPYYVNDLKPFVPDFKFLGDVLQKRQDMYNTNYKAINKAYSNVVYGNLMRDDTNEARNNFLTKIGPELEKVSGLDLSLQQNVLAAQGIFKPFYEEDIIVKDLVATKAAQEQFALAQRYAKSSDPNIRRKYWDIGIEDLQMQIDAFKNASREEALQMANPVYTEDPDLYNKVKAYLEGPEMKGRYKVSIPKYSDDRKWIITDTFGNDVTQAAMNDVMRVFQNDPAIQRGYRVLNKVTSYRAGKQLFEAQKASSIEEGINMHNKNLLSEIADNTAIQKNTIAENLDMYNELKAKHDEAQKTQKYLPGTQDFFVYQGILAQVAGLESQYKQAEEANSYVVEMLNSDDPDVINQSVGNAFILDQLQKDVTAAVTNYRTTNRIIKQDKNEYEFQRIAHQNALNLAHQNFLYQDELSRRKFKREQEAKDQENALNRALDEMMTVIGTDLNITTTGLDSDGNLTSEAEDVDAVLTNQTQLQQDGKAIVDDIKQVFDQLGIEVNMKDYEQPNAPSILYEKLLKEAELLAQSPTGKDEDKKAVLTQLLNNVYARVISHGALQKKFNEVNYLNIKEIVRLTDVEGTQQIPLIATKNGGIMSEEDYEKSYIQAVKNGEVYIENNTPSEKVIKNDQEIERLLASGEEMFLERTNTKTGETYSIINPVFYEDYKGEKYYSGPIGAGGQLRKTRGFAAARNRTKSFEEVYKGQGGIFTAYLGKVKSGQPETRSPFVNEIAARKAARAEYERQYAEANKVLRGEEVYKSKGAQFYTFGVEAQKLGDQSREANIGIMKGLPGYQVNFANPTVERLVDLKNLMSVVQNPNAEVVSNDLMTVMSRDQKEPLVNGLLKEIGLLRKDNDYTGFAMTVIPDVVQDGVEYNVYKVAMPSFPTKKGVTRVGSTPIITVRIPQDQDANPRYKEKLNSWNGIMSYQNSFTTEDPTNQYGSITIEKQKDVFNNVTYSLTPNYYTVNSNGVFTPIKGKTATGILPSNIDFSMDNAMQFLNQIYRSNISKYNTLTKKE